VIFTQLLISAYTLWKALDEEIEKLPAEEKPATAGYLLEKLALFISYFHYAVMPVQDDHLSPPQWLNPLATI